jgi:hypothetical protein
MRKKLICILLSTIFLLVPLTPIATALDSETINVTFGINIRANGKLFQPTDYTGRNIEIFSYADTVYLPIRAVSELFGADIGWDSSTFTVYLNTVIAHELRYEGAVVGPKLNTTRNIPITTNVRLLVNGLEFPIRDVGGNILPIIFYDGITYVPLDVINRAFNITCQWNRARNTVFLGASNGNEFIPVLPDGANDFTEGYNFWLQWDARWRNTTYGNHYSATNMGFAACGLFAVKNALFSLGTYVSLDEMHRHAIISGARVANAGTNMTRLLTYIRNNRIGGVTTLVITDNLRAVRDHIMTGGVAIVNVTSPRGGHFMTIVDYDEASEMFLVQDPGLSPTGYDTQRTPRAVGMIGDRQGTWIHPSSYRTQGSHYFLIW